MKRAIVLILVIAAAAGSAFAQAKIPAPKDQLYIEVSCLGGLDYFSAHKYGMKMVGEELGVKTDYVGPVDYDINAMVAAFEQAIARKPQGIVVFGSEPSLNSIVDKAWAQGIPVVTVDSDLPGSKRIAYVGTGNYNAGVLGGKELAKILDGKGKVAVIYHPGQLGLEQRLSGYRDALAPFKGIQIVQVVDDQGDTNIAAQVAAALLQKYPDLGGIACLEAAGGSGAATAVREANKVGKVKIISMDRGTEVLEGIAKGVVSASVVQQSALMPYYAVEILYNLVNSKVGISKDNKAAGITGEPVYVDTGSVIVDSSNYKYFMP